MHGFGIDEHLNDRNNKVRNFMPKKFMEFCNKHNLNIKKAYRYILTRNSNYDGEVVDKLEAYDNALDLLNLILIEEENETKFYIKK